MENKWITSAQNPLIKKINLLQTKKSARKKEGLFIIEGLRGVNEVPLEKLKELIISESSLSLKEQIKHQKSCIVVPDEIYKNISDTKTPQGVMAIVEIPEVQLGDLEQNEKGFYLVLENVQDPGNLGTLIRTAYGFGVDAILLTKGCVDVYNPKTIRSTMGALLHIPVVVDVELDQLFTWVEERQVVVHATDLQDSTELSGCNFTGNIAVVIGNEANGISEDMRSEAKVKMRIPMPGGLESLNAGIAGAVCMYEVMRQRSV